MSWRRDRSFCSCQSSHYNSPPVFSFSLGYLQNPEKAEGQSINNDLKQVFRIVFPQKFSMCGSMTFTCWLYCQALAKGLQNAKDLRPKYLHSHYLRPELVYFHKILLFPHINIHLPEIINGLLTFTAALFKLLPFTNKETIA